MSGYGEIFLLPDIPDLVEEMSSLYKHIQLATNLTCVKEDVLTGLSRLSQVSLCVSLDGHTPEMNGCRTSQEKIINRVCDTTLAAIDMGIPLEIYSTLTVRNTRNFVNFISFVKDRFPGVKCYPFLVRGHRNLQDFGEEPASALEPLIRHYSDFKDVLPSVEYVRRLIKFVRDGYRSWPCRVAFSNVGIDPGGRMLACACGLKMSLANVITSPDNAYKIRQHHPIFKRSITEVLQGCKGCFTHYEIINILLENTDAIKLSFFPWLDWEGSQNVISNLRQAIKENSLTKGK